MGKRGKRQESVLFGVVARSYLMSLRMRNTDSADYVQRLFHSLFLEAPELENCYVSDLTSDICLKIASGLRQPERRQHLRFHLEEAFLYARMRGWRSRLHSSR